jgi:hypothetical protein
VPVSNETQTEIMKLLEGSSRFWSPGAVSYMLRRAAGGPLGEAADPEIETTLRELWAANRIVRVEVCPGCGAPGELFGPPEAADMQNDGTRGATVGELSQALERLIEEGAVELSEHVELVENPCCTRTTRLWREPPPPI